MSSPYTQVVSLSYNVRPAPLGMTALLKWGNNSQPKEKSTKPQAYLWEDVYGII